MPSSSEWNKPINYVFLALGILGLLMPFFQSSGIEVTNNGNSNIQIVSDSPNSTNTQIVNVNAPLPRHLTDDLKEELDKFIEGKDIDYLAMYFPKGSYEGAVFAGDIRDYLLSKGLSFFHNGKLYGGAHEFIFDGYNYSIEEYEGGTRLVFYVGFNNQTN